MTTTQQQQLARIKNYHTRYELCASHPDGRRYLIIYNSQRSRSAIANSLRERLNDGSLMRVIGNNLLTWGNRAADGCTIGEWKIAFSGRTQRDCILGGELQFLPNVQ